MKNLTQAEVFSYLEPSAKQIELFHAAVNYRKQRVFMEVLIVEDQAFSRQLLGSLLRQSYTTHVAIDAKEAWNMYMTYAPDMVFLDIELPDIDGHRLAQILKAIDPEAYIVMVTANNSEDDVKRAIENGAKGFIIKPYSKDKILQAVEKFILKPKSNT